MKNKQIFLMLASKRFWLVVASFLLLGHQSLVQALEESGSRVLEGVLAAPLTAAKLEITPLANIGLAPSPIEPEISINDGNSAAAENPIIGAEKTVESLASGVMMPSGPKGSETVKDGGVIFDASGQNAGTIQDGDEKPRLRNKLIDPVTGQSTNKGKIQNWSLGHMVSVMTQRAFGKKKKMGEFAEFIGFITGHELEVFGADASGNKSYDFNEMKDLLHEANVATELVLAQYPELKAINPPQFDSDKEADAWMAAQEVLYGEELPVVQMNCPSLLIKELAGNALSDCK